MIRPLYLAHCVPPLLLLLLLTAASAAAEEEPKETPQNPDASVPAGEGAVYGGDERVVETLEQKGGNLGYSLVSNDGYGGRASGYGFLHSSRSGGLFYRALAKDGNSELEGNFLNENDYHGDLLLDYKGDYRLHLRTESLFHNLDRELLFAPDFPPAPAPATTATYHADPDPPENYGVAVTQDLAEFRYRLHNFPLHVNLGYWRLVREGTVQQRFADTSFEGTQNTLFARSRGVDRQIQEGRLGVDAHLGWVDLIYDFRIRVFEDRRATPLEHYVARNNELLDGVQQHNEDPDSRFISHTVKLHTSLAGGIVGSGSYSIGQRENLSRLTDTSGVKHAEVVLQNAAGDFVYTPCKEFSLALKYRRQEIDNGNRGVVSNINFANQVQPVKPPVDSTKDVALATFSFKPLRELSLTGEYRGEYLRRTNVSDLPTASTWALPENSSTQKGSLALLYHPAKGVRVTAKYSYAATDHPSYGDSFQQKHEGQFLTTYTGKKFGVTANLTARREWNDQVEHSLVQLVNLQFTDPIRYAASSPLSRDRATQNANLGVWFVPLERMTLAANYAYLHSRVDQGVLFTGVDAGQANPGSFAASNFATRSQVYGVNASYAALEQLDLSLMLQQIRSSSAFAPEPSIFSVDSITGAPTASTAGIREITEQDTVISSASVRGEYRFTSQLSCSLEYTWKDYNEKNPAYSAYNGTVHAVVAYLMAKW
ncbi:MAG TPA: MtrB/PioB family outer membrane beta-barrel protein [Geomonas sp.]